MKAIEFKARTDKGVIEIPNDIKNKLQQEVRVIKGPFQCRKDKNKGI